MDSDQRLRMTKGRKVSLIVLSSFEILLALGSIGTCIATVIYTTSTYFFCYYNQETSGCSPYRILYLLSYTAQGIWTGIFVLLSASMSMDFAVNPSRPAGSYNVGFSTLSFVFSTAMAAMEGIVVGSSFYSYNTGFYDYLLIDLHIGLLAIAAVLFILTFTTMIISSTAHGCCCRKQSGNSTPATVMTGSRDMQYPVQLPMATLPNNVPPYVMLPGNQNVLLPQPGIPSVQLVQPVQVQARAAAPQMPQFVVTSPAAFQNTHADVVDEAVTQVQTSGSPGSEPKYEDPDPQNAASKL